MLYVTLLLPESTIDEHKVADPMIEACV